MAGFRVMIYHMFLDISGAVDLMADEANPVFFGVLTSLARNLGQGFFELGKIVLDVGGQFVG
jgi:hypothetical protein